MNQPSNSIPWKRPKLWPVPQVGSVFILHLLVWSALGLGQRAWGDGAGAAARYV